MWTERELCECKIGFDGTNRAKARMAKEVAAFANSTGGALVYGVDPQDATVGVDAATVKALDPARVGDYLRKYLGDQAVGIEVRVVEDGSAVLVVIDVAPSEAPPIVMVTVGNVSDGNKRETLFRPGDVLVRDHTQARRAGPSDFDRWRDLARRQGEVAAYELMRTFVERPQGTVATFAPPDTAAERLRRAALAYRHDRSKLLTARELIGLVLDSSELDLDDPCIRELLFQSALRKRTTLWWWLSEIRPSPTWLEDQLLSVVGGNDRDVSDAGKPLLEVAALACPTAFDNLRIRLSSNTRYKHFREAAIAYPTSQHAAEALSRRTATVVGETARAQCLALLRKLESGEGSERSLTNQITKLALAVYMTSGESNS